MFRAILSTAAFSIVFTGAGIAQTDGSSTDPTDNSNSASETQPSAEMSTEGWSQPMLDTFFVSSELSTLRSATEISTSFAMLTEAEQDQVRAECAAMDGGDTAGGTSFGDATSVQEDAGSSGSLDGTAPDNSAGGANDAAVSGEGTPETVPSDSGSSAATSTNTNWSELCAIVGAL